MSTTQSEAREFTMSQYASKDDMIGAMRKRIAELEAQLAERAAQESAIGAGGVSAQDGWLQAGSLLYRLTDDRHPVNRDEINVTMADGSRSTEALTRRATELLGAMIGAAGDAGWRAQFDDWWRRNRVATHQVKSIGGFSAKVWLAAIQTVVGAMDSTAGFYPADEGSTPSRQATPPSSAKGVAHG